jgi:hypothetical protein
MNIEQFNSGCNKQKVDPRDRIYKPKLIHWTELDNIDLRSGCPPVRNQLHIGSCTAFASTALFDFVRRKNNLVKWTPSPLFTYYATRLADNTVEEDNGATVRNALKSTVRDGVAMERTWPYIPNKFTERPTQEAWDNAEKHQTLEYLVIDDFNKDAWLNCLNDGYPFIFGLNLYSSFFDPIFTMLGGFMQEPDRDNEKFVGGHCMMAVGYLKNHNNKEYLIVQNSWGTNWGDSGFCYIPLSYIMSNDSFDFWTIRTTEVCNEDTTDPTHEPIKPEPTPEPPKPEPVPEPVPAPTPEPPKPEPIPVPTPKPVDVKESKNSPSKVIIGIVLFLIGCMLVWMIFG